MQNQPRKKLIEVPINIGTKPDWNPRLGYPKLFNMFLGATGGTYMTPGLELIARIQNVRDIHFTPFRAGSYIVTTNTQVLRMTIDGTLTQIASIPYSGKSAQATENLQNQVSIVDGANLYVYDQNTGVFLTMGVDQGFLLTNPVSVTSLNNFAVVLSGNTNQWQISGPNNALVYSGFSPQQLQSTLTTGVCVTSLDNNLYFFGTTAIERWEPTYSVNDYLFPFQRDNNFRKDFGAISSGCVIRAIDNVYFVSSKFVPMVLNSQGLKPIADIGMSKIISQYSDIMTSEGSFYSFRGNYFYHLTFLTTGISWVYCQNTETWSQGDDLISASESNTEVVATSVGVFNLSLTPSYKRRILQPERLVLYKGQETFRNLLNGIEPRITQGLLQPSEPNYLEMSVSLDAQSWLNLPKQAIGFTGERNAKNVWRTNLATNKEITLKLQCDTNLDFAIEGFGIYYQ